MNTPMLFYIIILLVFNLTVATPPACFLNCINNLSHLCAKNQADIKCLCKIHEAVNQCAIRYCPKDHFYSARDHFSGTCVEHGFEFVSAPFDDDDYGDDDSSFEDPPEEYPHSEEEERAGSDSELSEYETDIPRNPASKPEDAEEWSEGEDWSESNEWPEEQDSNIPELNEDVIKNYMSYFIKNSPTSHPRIASVGGKSSQKHKVTDAKMPQKRPFIVHGPSSYVPESKKAPSAKLPTRKSRYHKFDVDFESEKQDQILRRRL